MWILVRNPDGKEVLFPFHFRGVDVERVKRGYRAAGGAVLAVYRRKMAELPDYD